MRASAIALLIAVVLPAAAGAQGRTGQGSPLSAEANYPYHCDYRWAPGYNGQQGAFGPGGYQDYTPFYVGASTCSIWNVGQKNQAQTTHLVPGTGTVTVARVRSGANPAQVSIGTVRLYEGKDQQGNLQKTCCYGVSQTEVVNPTPNAVTEIPVNLRVESQVYDPNTNKTGWTDIVVVNVHGTTGTLPMNDRGGPKPLVSPDSDFGARWYFPKFEPSVNNQNEWSATGFEVLMNYDWCPAASARQAGATCQKAADPPPTTTPPATTGPPTTTPAAPAATLAGGSKLTVRGKTVGVRITCGAPNPCAGKVRLLTRAKRPVVLGTKGLRIAAGKTATVKVPLSAKNRKRIGRKGLKVRAEIDLGAAGKITRNFTLRRA
jgi:hypothetical protein